MSKVFECPECQAPRFVEYHCASRTCTWLFCKVCQHATDIKSGRSIEIKRPTEGGMRV